jgi:hypothetical protein
MGEFVTVGAPRERFRALVDQVDAAYAEVPTAITTRPTGRTAAVRPGRHLPDATVVETRDERSGAQRCHDGFSVGSRPVSPPAAWDLIAGTRSP